ncbi:glycosyltransferase [Patulibacter minatonensis]|uniref:glycosyltransferase n=1 Tax=Patulibacter minatonensis TaxID=298163 RepID=UPI00146F9CBC|nr:glycosyltransferase [Patulibacter minatonensis]
MLQSVRLGGREASYMDHVAAGFGPEVRPMAFSYQTALAGRWDVFHVHWPESLLRHPSRLRRLLRRTLFALLVLRIAVTRGPVVRTVHNVRPHEPGPAVERWLLRRLDRRVGTWVRLNPVTTTPTDVPVVTIPHGHYVHELTDGAGRPPDPEPSRLLFFGFIRPYKGVEELIGVVAGMSDPEIRLTVAGKPASEASRAAVEAARAGDERIDLRLEFVPDDELGMLVAGAALVVLPYREMHNSGAVFAALSAGRPVLVERNAVTTELQSELGDDWIVLFDDRVDATDLRVALLRAAERDPTAHPDLSGRSWPEVAERYADVYRDLTDGRSGR